MSYVSFDYFVDGHIANIQINRPEKRNCLIREFWWELPDAISRANRSDDVRCILISAQGEMFSAGIDLAVLESLSDLGEDLEASRKAEYLRRIVLSLQDTLSCLNQTPLPVIAAIQGGCIGGAFDMVVAADVRIATPDTSFNPLEVALGFVPDIGVVQRLAGILPQGVAEDWLFDPRNISGEEAHRYGLVSRLSADNASLQTDAKNLAESIAAKSPMAIRGVKETLRFTRKYGIEASLEYTAAWQSGVFPGEDLAESMAARTERRVPSYQGLANSFPVFDEKH